MDEAAAIKFVNDRLENASINAIRQDALHSHRVPNTTPLGWVSNRHRRMVSVDLSPALRAKEFEKRLHKATLANAKWAVRRYLRVVKFSQLNLASMDDRMLKQVMKSYGVKDGDPMEYAVLLLKVGKA